MRTHSLILLVFAGFIISFVSTEGVSENRAEQTKQIELLLDRIEAMQGVVFIRNGKEYSSNKAADHLRLKWKKAGRRIETAEDFIELCGSRSSISGQPYKIRFPDGRLEDSAVILKELLKEIERSKENR
ncbi:MAG: DUF5329 family protein [Desulfobacterales bacterium]|jgi:hypothetical protein